MKVTVLSMLLLISNHVWAATSTISCEAIDGGTYLFALGEDDLRSVSVTLPQGGEASGAYNYIYGRPGTRNAGSIIGVTGTLTVHATAQTSLGRFALDSNIQSGWISIGDAQPIALRCN
jgi:hypothetical protein